MVEGRICSAFVTVLHKRVAHVQFVLRLLREVFHLAFGSSNQEVIDVPPCFRVSGDFESIGETFVVTRLFHVHGPCEKLCGEPSRCTCPCLRYAFGSWED